MYLQRIIAWIDSSRLSLHTSVAAWPQLHLSHCSLGFFFFLLQKAAVSVKDKKKNPTEHQLLGTKKQTSTVSLNN